MDFLRLLEKIRVPGLNELMLSVTELGGELPFLVIAMIIFWCVDKRRGYYVLAVGYLGTITNQFLKLCFRVPRPWVLDPEFTVLQQAREGATGYSFPSGHSQTAVGTFGALARSEKTKWLRILFLVPAVLVPFSRMYVGVHTPADVLAGAAISVLYLLILYPVMFREGGKRIPAVIGLMAVLSLVFLCFVEFWPFPGDIDPDNLASGAKSAYTLAGAMVGLIIVYLVDEKYLKFETEAIWWAQILKVIFGLLAVLAIKSGLKTPIDALCGGHLIGRSIRYFLIVIMAGIVWPLSFKWFSKLGRK